MSNMFIPNLYGHKIPDLLRLSYDIDYRNKCFRSADPDLALEDSLDSTARSLVKYGRQIANVQNKRLHQLKIVKKNYEDVAKLVDAKVIVSVNVGRLLEEIDRISPVDDIPGLAKQMGLLITENSDETGIAVDKVLSTSPQAAKDYRNGKKSAIGALVGLVMKSQKGLNPVVVREKLEEKLIIRE